MQQITFEFLVITFALGFLGNLILGFFSNILENFFDYNGLTTKEKVTILLGIICFIIVINYAIKLRVSS